MNILVISYAYPSQNKPYHGIFVEKLLLEFIKMGHDITVISPKRYILDSSIKYYEDSYKIKIYRPKYTSLSGRKVFGLNLSTITQKNFINSVVRTISKHQLKFDIVYSHFLSSSGIAACEVSELYNKPSFCAMGESSFENIDRYKDSLLKLNGIIIPSKSRQNELLSKFSLSNTYQISNGVDLTLYKKIDKVKAREILQLPLDEKIIIFVGSFIQRKGPRRVYEACKLLDKDLKMIFVGSGDFNVNDSDVLHNGLVLNEKIFLYLNASDVFVLPTLNEGMPNAVLEAMACQVPIVTSDIEPNIELLGEEYKYFCSPMSVESIAEKIDLCLKVKQTKYVDIFSIEKRANMILELFKKSI